MGVLQTKIAKVERVYVIASTRVTRTAVSPGYKATPDLPEPAEVQDHQQHQ
jgi:hypothetical protein